MSNSGSGINSGSLPLTQPITTTTTTGSAITIHNQPLTYHPLTINNNSGSTFWPSYNLTLVSVCPYVVLELPAEKKKHPEKIYLDGSLLAAGLLGTKVDVAYGPNCLIFEGKLFDYSDSKGYKIILEWYDTIYNYSITHIPYNNEKDTKLKVQLLSMVNKDVPKRRSRKNK